MINTNNISTEYQPIVNTKTLEIHSYEALSRFTDSAGNNLPPEPVFKLHSTNQIELKNLEIASKIIQLRDRPVGYPLFLNLSPHLIQDKKEQIYWANFFKNQDDIVVELVEREDKSLSHLNLMEEFKTRDVLFALDDFLCDNSVFCSLALIASPYVKIDKNFLKRIKEDRSYESILKGILSYCEANNKIVILEGIEDDEDLDIAKRNNVALVQGFYFKNLFCLSSNLKTA